LKTRVVGGGKKQKDLPTKRHQTQNSTEVPRTSHPLNAHEVKKVKNRVGRGERVGLGERKRDMKFHYALRKEKPTEIQILSNRHNPHLASSKKKTGIKEGTKQRGRGTNISQPHGKWEGTLMPRA